MMELQLRKFVNDRFTYRNTAQISRSVRFFRIFTVSASAPALMNNLTIFLTVIFYLLLLLPL